MVSLDGMGQLVDDQADVVGVSLNPGGADGDRGATGVGNGPCVLAEDDVDLRRWSVPVTSEHLRDDRVPLADQVAGLACPAGQLRHLAGVYHDPDFRRRVLIERTHSGPDGQDQDQEQARQEWLTHGCTPPTGPGIRPVL